MAADIVPQGNSIAVNGNYLGGLGLTGETWVDETTNRQLGQTYTNDTGKPIQIGVSVSSVTPAHELYIDGVLVMKGGSNTSSSNSFSTFQAIIPNGSTYMVNNTTDAVMDSWFELK